MWFTSSSLSAGINERERGRHGYCGGRNQSNLSLNSCELGQPAKLHLASDFPLCVYPETTASFQSAPHLCISLCLLPRPKDLFLSVFPLCFCLRTAIQTGKWTIINRKAGREREEAWTGVDMRKKGWGLLLYMKTKVKLLRCYQKHVFGENKEKFCPHHRLQWCFV